MVNSKLVYLRSLLHVFVGVTNGSLLGDFSGFGDEFVVDARLHVSPGAGNAALSCVREGSAVGDFSCFLN